MKENGDLPEWMLFPSERKNSPMSSKTLITLNEETSKRLDDLAEASDGLSRAEIVDDLVSTAWNSES